MCRCTKSGCRTRILDPSTSAGPETSCARRYAYHAGGRRVPAAGDDSRDACAYGGRVPTREPPPANAPAPPPVARVGRSVGRPAGLALFVALALPVGVTGQMRRDPSVQPVAEIRRGDLLVGVGLSYGANQTFPLLGLRGDLLSVGRLTLAYGLADAVILEIRGDLQNVLYLEPDPDAAPERPEPAVPLDPGTLDGTTHDFGDFRIGVLFAPIGSKEGLSAGGRLEVKLPNSDETRGIGTNTTDVRLSLLGGFGCGPVRATADLGVAILEAPLEGFEQNDVVVYSAELLYRMLEGRIRLALGLDGRAATRGHVLLGTEDLGEIRAGGEYAAGRLALDGEVALGYAGTSPDWAFRIGAAYRNVP